MVAAAFFGAAFWVGFICSKDYYCFEHQVYQRTNKLFLKEKIQDVDCGVLFGDEKVAPLHNHSNKPRTRAAFLISLASLPIAADAAETTYRKPRETIAKPSAKEESLSGFVAGATLAAVKTLVKHPLDTATVRLQTTASDSRSLNILFQSCYTGVTLPLVTNIPAGAVFFAVKDATKAALAGSAAGSNRAISTCIAVAVAQLPYWVVRNPSEVVKTRQQAGLPGYDTGPWNAVQQVLREDTMQQQQARGNSLRTEDVAPSSLQAFYTGYWENILYAYPADVLKFLCYDQLTKRQNAERIRPIDGAIAGALATAIAQCVTTPLDVVRNRVMTTTRTTGADSNRSTSVVSSYGTALVELAQQEGLAGLFAGVTPRVAKAFLSGAIQFATYEETKQEVAKLLLLRREQTQSQQ